MIGERAGLGDGLAEGIVDVHGCDAAVGVEIVGDVPVVIVKRNIDCAIDGEIEKSADASLALERAGQILAPVVADG